MTYSAQDHTDAVLAHLEDEQWLVGPTDDTDSGRPAGAGWAGVPRDSEFVPFVMVHMLSGTLRDGPQGDRHADSAVRVQIDAVGATRSQAERLLDYVDARIYSLDVPGRSVWVSFDMSGGVSPDTDVNPSLWTAVNRYRIYSTPSSSGS